MSSILYLIRDIWLSVNTFGRMCGQLILGHAYDEYMVLA
jgi:hypothetical protein